MNVKWKNYDTEPYISDTILLNKKIKTVDAHKRLNKTQGNAGSAHLQGVPSVTFICVALCLSLVQIFYAKKPRITFTIRKRHNCTTKEKNTAKRDSGKNIQNTHKRQTVGIHNILRSHKYKTKKSNISIGKWAKDTSRQVTEHNWLVRHKNAPHSGSSQGQENSGQETVISAFPMG